MVKYIFLTLLLTACGGLDVCNADNCQGPQGRPGPQGEPGPAGAPGPTGPKGLDGQNGADGATGPKGDTGATGADGKDGMDGEDGKDGTDGAPGQNGQDGKDGRDSIIAIIDPCGPNNRGVDELLFVLSTGQIVAWYQNVGLVALKNGSYRTTDGSNCVFKIVNGTYEGL